MVSGPSYGDEWSGFVKIGSTQLNIPSDVSYSINTEWVDFITLSGVTVGHNADGSGSVVISGSVTGPRGTSIASTTSSGSATVTLERIPRGFSSAPTITPKNIEERKYDLYWTTSETCSRIVLKIGGAVYNTYTVNGTSGTIQITGAAANSTYTIGATFTRKDSGIASSEITASVKTVAYPSLSSITPSTIKIGEGQTAALNNPLGRPITVYMRQNSTSGQILKQTSTSSKTAASIQPASADLYASIPNSKEGTAVYYCTYNDGSTTHTSSTLTGKYKIKEDTTENPTFSNNFTYADTNATTIALTGSNQIIVKDYSTVQVTIPLSAAATAKYSATMQKYQFGSELKDYSASADVTFTPKTVSTNSLSVTAIDSRQLPTSATKPIANWKEYFKPQITSATYERANNGSGTATTLRFSGIFWNDNFGTTANSLSMSYAWELQGSSSSAGDDVISQPVYGTTININPSDITISGNNFSGTVAMQGDLNAAGFSINQNFVITVMAHDGLTNATVFQFNLTSATPAIAIYKSNVAIGQKYDTTAGGKLQVNGKISANDEIITTKALKIPNTSTDGYGLVNEDGVSIIKDYNNNCVVLNATGAALFLGFQNTTSINILNGKATIDSNGNYSGKAANVTQVKSLSSKSHSNYGTNNGYLPDMSFIAYWNGAYSSGNASNLTYAHQGTIQCKPTSLYNNTSGTTGTVSWTGNAASTFVYIDIYYAKNNCYKMCRVYGPNGKSVTLDLSFRSSTLIQQQTATVTISGSQITKSSSTYGGFNVNVGGTAVNTFTTNEIYIYRVDGWK